MTPNTIAYANLLENKRHNTVSEKQNAQRLSNDFTLGKASNAIAAMNANTNLRNALTNLFTAQSNAQKWVAELAQTKKRDQQTYFTNLERNKIQQYATDVTKYLGEIQAEIQRERSSWEKDVAKENAAANTRNAESNNRNSWTNRYRQIQDADELTFRRELDKAVVKIDKMIQMAEHYRNKKYKTWDGINNSVKSIGSLVSGIGGIFGKGKGK